VINATQWQLPDSTQQSQQTDIHETGGIRTHNPNKPTASDPRLRARPLRTSQNVNIAKLRWNRNFDLNVEEDYLICEIENQKLHQNNHFIVMSSQTLLHVSAYLRHHQERSNRHHNKVVILMQLLVFYKDIYQTARSSHQDENARVCNYIAMCQQAYFLRKSWQYFKSEKLLTDVFMTNYVKMCSEGLVNTLPKQRVMPSQQVPLNICDAYYLEMLWSPEDLTAKPNNCKYVKLYAYRILKLYHTHAPIIWHCFSLAANKTQLPCKF
jgi:hypothetical protein